MFSVHVFYGETRPLRRGLRCAQDFASAFSEHPVTVLVAGDPAAADACGIDARTLDAIQEDRVAAACASSRPDAAPARIRPFSGELYPAMPDTLYVSRTLGSRHRQFHVLNPAEEESLRQRGAGPILLPFSDGSNGLIAATVALDMAQWRRGDAGPEGPADVVLYHTTWSDSHVSSDDPLDHMCDGAVRVMLALEALARGRGLRSTTVVGRHDDVVQGVIEAAQRAHASVVVVARGNRIRHGSYVERMLERSPAPVLVVGDRTPPAAEAAADADLERFRAARAASPARDDARPAEWRPHAGTPSVLTRPSTAVFIGGLSYLVKSVAKIAAGKTFASPMVAGDGFHNLADLLQTGALALSLFIASRPTGGRYPWGRRNVEWFTQLGIGVVLMLVACTFVVDCVLGGLACWPEADLRVRELIPFLPVVEVVRADAKSFPVVLAVTGLSLISSLVISRYQIAIGRRACSASLVAGGEEMRSDGWIEMVTVGGLLLEFATGWHFIEYPLGLLVAGLVMHTAWDLISRGWRVLMQHSLGDEAERAVVAACGSVHGVERVCELKTFLSGDTAVVLVTVESLAREAAQHFVEKGVADTIPAALKALPDKAFKNVYVHATVTLPNPGRRRVGYPLVVNGDHRLIAPHLERATHLAVCDLEFDEPVRTKVIPIAEDPIRQLIEKRITAVYAFSPSSEQRRLFALDAERRRQAMEAEWRNAAGMTGPDGGDASARPAPGTAAERPLPRLEQSTCYVPIACGVVM